MKNAWLNIKDTFTIVCPVLAELLRRPMLR